jgi:hypothetical protein
MIPSNLASLNNNSSNRINNIMNNYNWTGLNLKLKNIKKARDYLRQFKNMSIVIRLNNNNDYELLNKAKFKMHGLSNIKLINGLDNPRAYHFDYTKR